MAVRPLPAEDGVPAGGAGRESRVVSTVLYLNRDWQPDDGGDLVLFDPATGAAFSRASRSQTCPRAA